MNAQISPQSVLYAHSAEALALPRGDIDAFYVKGSEGVAVALAAGAAKSKTGTR